MSRSRAEKWVNTTHDWAADVDQVHLADIRSDPGAYAPGGLLHLVLEVVAYANDEAEALARPGNCVVILHPDGSVSVADDGRGTDTRRGSDGEMVKKPVMATKDLRFFDHPHEVLLPDGAPRRGMSVVAALSRWLVHTNRRQNGAWTQRYEQGVPTSDLQPIESTHRTGTTVRFLVNRNLVPASSVTSEAIGKAATYPWLSLEVLTE